MTSTSNSKRQRHKSTISPSNVPKRKVSSLVDTHRNVLKLLKSSGDLFGTGKHDDKSATKSAGNPPNDFGSNNGSWKGLQDLRRQRIFLASEVARARSESQLSTIDLCIRDPSSSMTILRGVANELDSSFAPDDDPPIISLATSLQQMRTKRKLVAGCRLGGITAAIPHADSEVLSVRFDICLEEEGSSSYVACYHAFFDLIMEATNSLATDNIKKNNNNLSCSDDEDRSESTNRGPNDNSNNKHHSADPPSTLYLRLVQHTIPSAIPTLALCEKILGGSLFPLGNLHQKETWSKDKLKDGLRSWCRQIYQACWCWERRKQDWKCLEKVEKQQQRAKQQAPAKRSYKSKKNEENRGGSHVLVVGNLATTASDSLHQISFHLWSPHGNVRHHPMPFGLAVKLSNDGWVHGRPKSVDVEIIHQQQTQSGDDGSAAAMPPLTNQQKQLVDLVQRAFLDKPVKNALNFLRSHEQQLWMS